MRSRLLALAAAALLLAAPAAPAQECPIDPLVPDPCGFVLPFTAFTGLPERPGHGNFRLTSIWTLFLDGSLRSDFGGNFEVGLGKSLALKVRSVGFEYAEYPFSQIVAQRTIVADSGLRNGISAVAGMEVATQPVRLPETRTVKGLLGVAGRTWLWESGTLNATVMFNPVEYALQYDAALTTRVGTRFFPVFEARGYYNNVNYSYFLTGVKFFIYRDVAFGLGVELPVYTSNYSSLRLLFTYGQGF